MIIRNTSWLLMGTVLVGLVGCASDDKNLGDGSTATLGAALGDYAGNWDGYAEAYEFLDGSDRVRVTLDAQGQGTLVVGDSPQAAAPTDPDAPYPPSGAEYGTRALNPELTHPVLDASVSDRRIKFDVSTVGGYADYCALLPPIPDPVNQPPESSGYSCFRQFEIVATWRDSYCGGACQCTATECYPHPGDRGVKLDAALTAAGEELVGSLSVHDERVNVRLSRTP